MGDAETDQSSASAENLLENSPPCHCRADSLHFCSAGGVVRAAASRASHKAWIRDCRLHGRSVDHARYGLCACRLGRMLSVLGLRRGQVSGGVQWVCQ
jgi:hypothetical protein